MGYYVYTVFVKKFPTPYAAFFLLKQIRTYFKNRLESHYWHYAKEENAMKGLSGDAEPKIKIWHLACGFICHKIHGFKGDLYVKFRRHFVDLGRGGIV